LIAYGLLEARISWRESGSSELKSVGREKDLADVREFEKLP